MARNQVWGLQCQERSDVQNHTKELLAVRGTLSSPLGLWLTPLTVGSGRCPQNPRSCPLEGAHVCYLQGQSGAGSVQASLHPKLPPRVSCRLVMSHGGEPGASACSLAARPPGEAFLVKVEDS